MDLRIEMSWRTIWALVVVLQAMVVMGWAAIDTKYGDTPLWYGLCIIWCDALFSFWLIGRICPPLNSRPQQCCTDENHRNIRGGEIH